MAAACVHACGRKPDENPWQAPPTDALEVECGRMPQSLAHVAWNTVCDMKMVLKIHIFSESMTLKIKCVYTGPPALDSSCGEVNFGRGDRDGASHRLRTVPNAGEEVASA